MTDYKLAGGPTDNELLEWAEDEQFFLFCDEDEFLQIARSVIHKYGRKGTVDEPVATIESAYSGDPDTRGSRRVVVIDHHRVNQLGVGTKLYVTPQLTEQKPAPDVAQLVEALEIIAESCDVGRHDGLPEEGPTLCAAESWLIAIDALAAYHKQGGKQ